MIPKLELEKIEVLGLDVPDVDAAIELFSPLLDTEFIRFEFHEGIEIERFDCDGGDVAALSPAGTIVAIDRRGLVELIQTDPPVATSAMRNIHVKVPDLDAAVEALRSNGFTVVANMRIGELREAVVDARDLFGMRMCLVQYEGHSMVEAMVRGHT